MNSTLSTLGEFLNAPRLCPKKTHSPAVSPTNVYRGHSAERKNTSLPSPPQTGDCFFFAFIGLGHASSFSLLLLSQIKRRRKGERGMERGGKCAPPADFFCSLEKRTCKKCICSTSSCGVKVSLKTLSVPQDCDAWKKSLFCTFFHGREKGGYFGSKSVSCPQGRDLFPKTFAGCLVHLGRCCISGSSFWR